MHTHSISATISDGFSYVYQCWLHHPKHSRGCSAMNQSGSMHISSSVLLNLDSTWVALYHSHTSYRAKSWKNKLSDKLLIHRDYFYTLIETFSKLNTSIYHCDIMQITENSNKTSTTVNTTWLYVPLCPDHRRSKRWTEFPGLKSEASAEVS